MATLRRVPREIKRARFAVVVLFMINAAAYANIVPRLPAIKAELELSNTALGTAVAAVPAGALLSGLAAGRLVARWGSGAVACGCGVGFALVLPVIGVAGAWWVLAAAFLVFGLLDSVMDVSMNAHGLRVQRSYGRSIVSGLHGFWSVGAVVGGLAATAAAGADVALPAHLVVAALVVLAATVAASQMVLGGPDDAERADLASDAGPRWWRAPGVVRRLSLLGGLVVLGAVVEDAPASWGAVLLRTELEAGAAVAGLVFVAFQVAMTVSRLAGDRVVDRVGDVTVVRAGGIAIAAGAGVGLAVGRPVAVIAGFAVAGLGAASLFPLVFHAAGNLGGVATGSGVAVVAWMSRVGFLVVPPVVGAIGDAVGLRAGLAVVPAAGVAITLMAGVLAPGDARSPDEQPLDGTTGSRAPTGGS